MTEEEEDAPGPVTLADAVLRTPLHRLPAGFTWGLWGLGGALGGMPVIVWVGAGEPLTRVVIATSLVFSGMLVFGYLLMTYATHRRYGRWIGWLCGLLIAAVLAADYLNRMLP